ncbi:MAG: S9 family peptidase [Gemmatimonadetes bacterium]|nr:S9 family peptidase [Gemmatimonadota bacterium]
MRALSRCLLVAASLAVFSLPTSAQQLPPYRPDSVSASDYARAEHHMAGDMNPLVSGGSVRPNWLEGDRFWYRNQIAQGAEYILVDPRGKKRARAFDHEAVARALSAAADTTLGAFDLTMTALTDQGPQLSVGRRSFVCDAQGTRCAAAPRERRADRNAVVSPDGTQEVFIRDYNLWVRDVSTGQETQLTTDGVQDYGYGTNNAGWTRRDSPVVLWSPDSKKIATFQMDERGVGDMYLVSTAVGHPTLEAWKYPLPEDTVIFRISRVVIDLDGPKVVRLQMPPDQHRSTICDDIYCGGTFADVEWSPDSKQLAFVSTSRNHQDEVLRMADPATGAVRDVLEEHVNTFFESGFNEVNWHVLEGSNDVLWYSERSDWGHLYLYDLTTGQLKHPVTQGDWNVLQVRNVDRKARKLYFTGAGREPGDPYFQYFYSVSIDAKGRPGDVKLLTPDSADHAITLSPDGKYFVDTWSTPVIPPTSVLRDMNGKVVVPLEKADISRLVAAGWKAPIPFTTKARDGKTDLYGIMYTPTNLDTTRKYPVINYLYPGPQTGSVGSRQFSAARRDNQALAELGFIVVTVDAMGTPMRSKSFHASYYGDMGDNGLPDQIATIKQLAAVHPWMDLTRVGIWGHSGGGFASADGILRYPDFYKVAWSESGNHDNRIYEDDWGEKWQGLLKTNPDGTTNYDNQANELLAKNLKGKLMLVHGTMDNNVPPNNTLAVVDALVKANKDFDLLLLPNQRHGYGEDNAYATRRRWDYFVRNLLGAEPPKEYEMSDAMSGRPRR